MTDALLPLANGEAERCDAARNRRLLLDAAVALVDERGPDGLTMDAVAARAGVGKGTVFRRFGSRAGLMLALLDHTETALQQSYMFGPPPLGPGAPPLDRLLAYGRARFGVVEVQGELLRSAENSGSSRFAAPAWAVGFTHVASLLRAAEVQGDVELLTYAVLAPLEATVVLHQLRDGRMTPERLVAGWEDLVLRVTRPVPADTPRSRE
ncbi:TetR/AcrR family transcriptional regulator [Rhodococcoides corynebacterioides]|uniref:TetR/AcrR family transcriptional regulator n=1 Tax=Rhodococcoides corynebacterioides TaxID=53972 RepID=UPI000831E78D|nr:TetR/AcrR family transcriptional regulator [Rhodococcus corynebacterioides]